ncbi:CfaE/CblD family pilus tip adhesin [Chimaeribacter arupi]|uniref:CfaE/CblD family pilus tip adhesin n=1 Tax=Chimaeribacter arupi TaxID=2060066 RepID=UPI001F4DF019|nr:CfaE/CblD family pilus tip adhesin [Chimaeribacter arupi]
MKYILIFWLVCLPCLAQAEMQPPAPSNVTIQRTFDRASPPGGDIILWEHESGGWDEADHAKWGRNGWVCESNSDPKQGKCNTKLEWASTGNTTVPLTFTEKRSGMKVVLNLQGYSEQYFRQTMCAAYGGRYQIWGSAYVICPDGNPDDLNVGRALNMALPAAELAQLPVGGLWEADLRLKLMQWDPNIFLADFTAHLQFDVIDPNHIEIYFPAFRTASPLVELDLRPQGAPDGNPWAQDVTPLDMCLYDGYNANSTKYELTLKDEGKPHAGRPRDADFSLYRDGENSNPDSLRDRIDYAVLLKNPETGHLERARNNSTFIWNAINQNLIRPVRLPSLSYPVLCVPVPLLINVEKFEVTTKNAGRYTGKLTVVFTPTTPTVN